MTNPEATEPTAVEAALSDAERKGFRLAVLGRTGTLVAIGVYYLLAFQWPNNLVPSVVILAVAVTGLAPLALVGNRRERQGRFAFFAFEREFDGHRRTFASASLQVRSPPGLWVVPQVRRIRSMETP